MIRPRRADGFTLLEVLLAIGLIALITGSIVGGLNIGKRAWDAGRDYESVQEVEDAARALAEILSRAFPGGQQLEDGRQLIVFHGARERLRLVTISEGGAGWGGLTATEIGLDGADLSIWTNVYRAEEWSAGGHATMRAAKALRGAETFSLSYFGADDAQGKGQGQAPGQLQAQAQPRWSDEWVDRPTTPRLVTARLGARRNGKRIEVSFTVALRQRPE
jgi:general secretion pathway protein J